eukprot:s483_g7.t1
MTTGRATNAYPLAMPGPECYLLGRTGPLTQVTLDQHQPPPGFENYQGLLHLETMKAASLLPLPTLLAPLPPCIKSSPAPKESGLPILLSREDVAIGKVVRNQDGAEIVSQLLAADASATPFVVTSLLPDLPFLASHPHGAGVISDLFEACRRAPDRGAATIPAMTRRLQGSLLRLTRDRWGCRVMQAALEDAAPDFQQAFANELQGKALKLCQHLHANFVLQKYVELVPASSAGFLLEELTPHAMEVAVHVYGCRVLQRLIEHCPREPQLASLLESVLSAVPQIEKLLKDPFGSNVLRAVVAYGSDAQVKAIMAAISTNVLKFAKHKHASLVFERCLEASSERSGDFPERDMLVALLLGDGTSRAPLAQVLLDRFGNYLAQRMIHCCKGEEEPRVLNLLARCLPKLQRSPQGRHITIAAQKRFGCMPGVPGNIGMSAQASGRPSANLGAQA